MKGVAGDWKIWDDNLRVLTIIALERPVTQANELLKEPKMQRAGASRQHAAYTKLPARMLDASQRRIKRPRIQSLDLLMVATRGGPATGSQLSTPSSRVVRDVMSDHISTLINVIPSPVAYIGRGLCYPNQAVFSRVNEGGTKKATAERAYRQFQHGHCRSAQAAKRCLAG
jgi:hypothetical protein